MKPSQHLRVHLPPAALFSNPHRPQHQVKKQESAEQLSPLPLSPGGGQYRSLAMDQDHEAEAEKRLLDGDGDSGYFGSRPVAAASGGMKQLTARIRQWLAIHHKKLGSSSLRRLLVTFLALFILLTTIHTFTSSSAGSSITASSYQSLPYDYARDAGRSVPSRFGGTSVFNKLKGLANNVYNYRGATREWYVPPTEILESPSPLARFASGHIPREIDISSDALPLEAPLSARLDHWQASPGGRGPGLHLGLDGKIHEELELGAYNAINREACASVGHQMNTHMPQHAAHVWGTMNRTTVWETRMQLIEWMRHEVVAKNKTADYGFGRGIVMVAGNADTLERVKWSVAYMRSQGTTLPVQVYHFPSEAPSPDAQIRTELSELAVELVEAIGQSKDEGKTKSYHLKALAVVQCPWREVLYLDSDSIPLRDPEYMFDSPSYLRTRFWATPDYWKTSANNPIWAILGIRCRNEWEMEAGQIFVDKKYHLDVFLLTQYMLEDHRYWFWYSDGDKDIFRWALLALRKRWGVPGRWVAASALAGNTASGWCGHTMTQFDAYGDPLFIHYNLMKQIPSGIGRGFSWGKMKQMPLFNSFPPERKHAHANELPYSDHDLALRGLGDVDVDMLTDADDEGYARAPAREEIRRRAARERGVKANFHGGWISALCIDLNYQDPRPESVRKAEEAHRDSLRETRERLEREWEDEKRAAQEAHPPLPEPRKSAALLAAEGAEMTFEIGNEEGSGVQPNWDESPIEEVWWRDHPMLKDFEEAIYNLGFVPSGQGF
ncbi:hypothetical protein QFC21_006798 [Naganishia friedmannii]|uniref:Uncharacterized protein n=1 Tax=Naganishia friedmannii TaxID=89922 RepID=A0ACC2V1S4_9TREE|nr:hypothetical protein QFC21_006798 [Naganishia friedmannii]